ncbi:histidine kinase [Chroococcidiopsis cubana SAG 39.79]|jgi:two-component system, cell cycle sensor histidine kinase and response regulator CckA|uniref:histidine kinase n=1 Tax=Chroococcidiopsis cubana SAG 39.79 TaxID=388085 RepID=A0AB37UJ51_9CYAN|nr:MULTISPECIES: response regulator [Chroococcidiopsis]PSB56959.1 hybrid sensor histidine kinase/response regulator [Chroococcidiopsis cubana CCALA 043]RUT11408.1 histidine kinase [Chroococcidiopsis cubana SAG 39.79]URD51981.1 response regulator [Chroococcidiopsis sp. CCNUC1]
MDTERVKVLLVDDDEDDYVLTRDWLAAAQGTTFDLDWVSSYDEAIATIAQCQHDIYLLDYRLGDRNGLELLQAAVAEGCAAPIILLTGKGDREIDIEAMKAGAADYLEKTQLSAPLLERSIRYALERQHTQQQIRAQAELLDVATDAIIVRSLDDKVLYWNKGAERLYGWQAQEAIGRNPNLLIYNESLVDQLLEIHTALKQTDTWQGELHQVTKNEKPIVVYSRWTLVRDRQAQPKSILVVNTDITEKKLLEAQFLRAQRLESIGTLASGIAHDLNNVLAPILMTAQLLESQMHDERSQRLLPIVVTNAKRGAALVKQVLSFARGLEGTYTNLQIKHLISEIRQIAKQTFPKSIEVQTNIASNLWSVSGDATQLHQVLMNLCVNARDAMPNGGTLTISAENFTADEHYARMNLEAKAGSYIVVTVRDTGQGMSLETQERIFEPFFTTKELGKGTGLGLSTVMGIVKGHNGFIQVWSELGRGTEFQVYLPAVAVVEYYRQTEQDTPYGNGELILVVDDEAGVREATKTSLETFNYKVVTASDGIEAIATYAEHRDRIDLILIDMLMPAMDGITTIRTIQKLNPQTKIIATSGLAAQDKFHGMTDIEVQAFLAKPYTAQELLQTMKQVLCSQPVGC